MTRVVVAAVSDVARAGLGSLLAGLEDVEVSGRAADADALASLLRSASPDVALIDVESRDDDAAAMVAAVAGDPARPAVVLLTDDPLEVERPQGRASAGWAILPRRSGSAEIDAAIRATAAGL